MQDSQTGSVPQTGPIPQNELNDVIRISPGNDVTILQKLAEVVGMTSRWPCLWDFHTLFSPVCGIVIVCRNYLVCGNWPSLWELA